jgi:hypothetical protein
VDLLEVEVVLGEAEGGVAEEVVGGEVGEVVLEDGGGVRVGVTTGLLMLLRVRRPPCSEVVSARSSRAWL